MPCWDVAAGLQALWSPHADCLLPTATLSLPMAAPSVLASPVGVRVVAPSSATTAVSPGTPMGPVHQHR